MASISSSVNGLRLGRSEAGPPTAVWEGGDGTSDLKREFLISPEDGASTLAPERET